jgi:hypothetical protein
MILPENGLLLGVILPGLDRDYLLEQKLRKIMSGNGVKSTTAQVHMSAEVSQDQAMEKGIAFPILPALWGSILVRNLR